MAVSNVPELNTVATSGSIYVKIMEADNACFTALGSATADVTLKFKAAVLLVAAEGYVPDQTTFGVSVTSGSVASQPDLSALPARFTTITE